MGSLLSIRPVKTAEINSVFHGPTTSSGTPLTVSLDPPEAIIIPLMSPPTGRVLKYSSPLHRLYALLLFLFELYRYFEMILVEALAI